MSQNPDDSLASTNQSVLANDNQSNKTSCNPSLQAPNTHTANELTDILVNTPKQALANTDRQSNYLRWLAFYYLSKREHSQSELKKKLLAKGCDTDAVEALLVEFVQKDYQSDLRTALMIIKEGLRLGRGRRHIEQKLWQSGVEVNYSIDQLMHMLGDSFDKTDDNESVDWLKLAVQARCKKYGNSLPTDPKEKARQLRFLQYRGFEMAVCFDALKHSLDDFDN